MKKFANSVSSMTLLIGTILRTKILRTVAYTVEPILYSDFSKNGESEFIFDDELKDDDFVHICIPGDSVASADSFKKIVDSQFQCVKEMGQNVDGYNPNDSERQGYLLKMTYKYLSEFLYFFVIEFIFIYQQKF